MSSQRSNLPPSGRHNADGYETISMAVVLARRLPTSVACGGTKLTSLRERQNELLKAARHRRSVKGFL